MQIWPAIDLRGGKCVRLQQGDYDRETVFGDDPAAMAQHWVAEGAECLHLVDLDGARDGRPTNLPAIESILAAVDVPCELGGGIRDEQTVRQLLDAGLSRLVIGTRALAEPEWFRKLAREVPGRLVLGIDARDGQVATDGWLRTSGVRATELARDFSNEPLAAIIYTDIATDGMLCGPNLAAMREMQAATRLPVIASGGIHAADDMRKLAELGLAGCIIGRALYDKKFTLREALAAAAAGGSRQADQLV
jgi:phosphoribosylformimino-5-aminoimidazole carboxamide ribotide isomerase